LKLLFHSPRSS